MDLRTGQVYFGRSVAASGGSGTIYVGGKRARGPARYTTHGKELADGYDNVMAFVERLHAESMEIFGRLTDEDLQKKCKTPDDAPITTWK